jgi:anti-sigma factor ChrR (cupin superfamily)
VINTRKLEWQPGSIPGVAVKSLYQQPGFHDAMRLERWDPQTDLGTITYERGVEFFVLDGGFADEAGTYAEGCWMRLPAGSEHRPRSADGCTLYIKTAGLPYLRSVAA